MFRLLLIAFFLFHTLMPAHAAARSSDQPNLERQLNSPFLTLTHLELGHDFWSKILGLSSSTSTLLDSFYESKLDTCYSTLGLTETECDRLLEVMKSGFMHITKDIVPEQFWEEQLAMFYSRVLTQNEAQLYVVSYENLAGTPAEDKLVRLRAAFVKEVLPSLVPQIKAMAQSFKTRSGGMAPSLLAGDYFIVNKLAYQEQNPGRGDVVVFKYPEDESLSFVKRIVGLPGDKIEIRDKIVYLNGEILRQDYQTQHLDSKIIEKAINPRDNMGPVTVLEGSYFVLGDNRDQSLDSRFWGFVRRDKIIGKPSIIYWSWDETAKTSRWERVGQKIR